MTEVHSNVEQAPTTGAEAITAKAALLREAEEHDQIIVEPLTG